jgi:CBS domain-containing protein
MEYTRATGIAVGIGRLMAWLMGLYGFLGGGFFLILVAFFVYIGAGQEEELVKTRVALRGLTVRQAYSQQVQTLRPENTLQDAINLTFSSLQASFPVCDGEFLVGLLTYPKLVEALHANGPDYPVGQAMVPGVPLASPSDELIDVQEAFNSSQLDALPVVENGRFLGLITARDIAEVYRLLSIAPNLLPRARPA